MIADTITQTTILEEWQFRDLIYETFLEPDSLAEFTNWLGQLPSNRRIDPSDPCGCFFHQYMQDIYPMGQFSVGTRNIYEGNAAVHLFVLDGDLPQWYTTFQHAAMAIADEEDDAAISVGTAHDLAMDLLNPFN